MSSLTEYALKIFGDPHKYQKNLKYFYFTNRHFQCIPGLKNPYNVTRVLLHPLLHKPFENILFDISMDGLGDKIKSFDGCFLIRDIRGIPGVYSVHSWALALDFNAETNKLGTEGDIDQKIIKIFEKHGFDWGGYFNRKDPMHFQASIKLLRGEL